MKIRLVILAGILVILVIGIASAFYESESIHENKIRVAFFPNIGHAVPIVGYESGIFPTSSS